MFAYNSPINKSIHISYPSLCSSINRSISAHTKLPNVLAVCLSLQTIFIIPLLSFFLSFLSPCSPYYLILLPLIKHLSHYISRLSSLFYLVLPPVILIFLLSCCIPSYQTFILSRFFLIIYILFDLTVSFTYYPSISLFTIY